MLDNAGSTAVELAVIILPVVVLALGARLFGIPGIVRGNRPGAAGAAAVELALTAPLLAFLALGIVDYGAVMNSAASLEGATRAVAEYAVNSSQCLVVGLTSSSCISGINSLVSTLQSNNSLLSSATFNTPSAPLSTTGNYCTCTTSSAPVPCSTSCSSGSCSSNSDPRVLQYIQVSATQNYAPQFTVTNFVYLGGFGGLPTSLSAQTTLRISSLCGLP
jgi:Flp pilus assembly protein TadG